LIRDDLTVLAAADVAVQCLELAVEVDDDIKGRRGTACSSGA
jgi:hypothetical protein